MASSRALSVALWAAFALFAVFCLSSNLFYAPTAHPRQLHRRQEVFLQPVASLAPKSVPIITRHSAGHQNPEVAPPKPLHEALKDDSLGVVSTNNASAMSLKTRGLDESLFRRDGGPLYCTNGPCVDGSCCGKNKICGYGPDYCGDGCQSQCNATAMCGEFSENGEMPCGMNLCCSATGWCGTTSVYCDNADPLHGTLPCQAGYGSCQTYATPSCGASGSTKGRSVGYYQSWNVRERKCNTVSPSQLDTSLYTHLFYAFASIDPATFAITNAHPDDEKMIPEFTALHRNGAGPQTWIAVGGFDFSDVGPTHRTWSELCASKANRAAFISSVKAYMDKYGFQGVDLDWEYPGAPERGGNKLADVRNFPILLREMRAAFGSKYGISLTLAPDYWYLRWFDAKAMEPSVDFFGFMAYDLHGSWDQDVLTLGKIIRGQADIREIDKNSIPLWFDGLNPAKINFGLAMYGRGYTVADPSCNYLGCSFSAASKPGECTGFNGVLSLWEIKKLIKEKGYTSTYLPDSMMKQLTWEDQWIGYDDEETFAAKKAWADSRCFGGSMVWGIDYGVGGTGSPDDNYPAVYLDPTVFNQIPAQCTPPCRLVFPPSSLAEPSTISIPPYTTSLQIAPGTTTTITITPPALTVTSMSYFNMIISPGQDTASATITPYLSVDVPHVTTVVAGQTRTLILPPWPLITNGPPDHWDNTSPGSPSQTTNPGGDAPISEIPLPDITPDTNPITFPPLTKPDYSGVRPIAPWPTNVEIKPVETPVPENGEDDDGNDQHWKSPCSLWFFFVCIKWPGPFNVNLQGWNWNLPTGVWGPGVAPPGIQWPPGLTLKGKLPPWPKITVHPGGSVEAGPKPTDCEPVEASLCLTKSYFATTTRAGGVTVTTGTSTTETCATITGCNLKDASTDVSHDVCTLRRRHLDADDDAGLPLPIAQPTDTPAAEVVPRQASKERKIHLAPRAEPDWSCETSNKGMNGIIWPANPDNDAEQESIRQVLRSREAAIGKSWREVRAQDLGVTSFYFIEDMGWSAWYFFNSNQMRQVILAYWPKDPSLPLGAPARRRDIWNPQNATEAESSAVVQTRHERTLTEEKLTKRALNYDKTDKWHLSMVSWPKGNFDFDANQFPFHNPSVNAYAESWDDSRGQGQTIYIMEAGLPDSTEWGSRLTRLTDSVFGDYAQTFQSHGLHVMALAGGETYGIARNANLVWSKIAMDNPRDTPQESILEGFVRIANHAAGIPKDTCVVNMSWGVYLGGPVSSRYFELMKMLMTKMEDKYGCLFVAAPGNDGQKGKAYPALAVHNVKGMMVAGAVQKDGRGYTGNSDNPFDLINMYAPGVDVPVPSGIDTGTSFASPLVAGMAAYYRGLPSYAGGRDPTTIRWYMQQYARAIKTTQATLGLRVIWNGNQFSRTCNNPNAKRDDGVSGGDGGSCGLNPGGNNGGDGGSGGGNSGDSTRPRGPPMPFRTGTPGPICSASCGTLCEGYYCDATATPTGQPPDFTSPAVTPTQPPIVISAMPTLSTGPNTAIPSDCTSTTTWTTCALGLPPGASACQTLSSCAGIAKPTTTSAASAKPTWTRPSSFPSPTDFPGATYSCGTGGTSLNWAACDTAAKQFFQDQPDKMYWTTRDGNRQICVKGTDTKGQPAGCMINLLLSSRDAPADATSCGWSGKTGLQWYSNIMSHNCEKSASLMSKGGCVITVMTDYFCLDT